MTQGNLFRLFLRDQLIDNIRIHPNKPMIGILLFQMVDKVCIQLSIHQQHIISLALGRLDIRVLFFHIRGIQEHHLIIFIRLIGFNQVLVLFIREIFSFRILEQEDALGSLGKFFIRQHTILDENLQIIPFLLVIFPFIRENITQTVSHFLCDMA